jgi:hypothetical protein
MEGEPPSNSSIDIEEKCARGNADTAQANADQQLALKSEKKPKSLLSKIWGVMAGILRLSLFIMVIALWVQYGFWIMCFAATLLFSLFSIGLLLNAVLGNRNLPQDRKRKITREQIIENIPTVFLLIFVLISYLYGNLSPDVMEIIGKIGFALFIIMIIAVMIAMLIEWMGQEKIKRSTSYFGLIKMGFQWVLRELKKKWADIEHDIFGKMGEEFDQSHGKAKQSEANPELRNEEEEKKD